MRRTTAIAFSLALISVAITLVAGVIPVRGSESLPDLFDAASMVFAGEIISVKQTGERDGYWRGRQVRLQLFTATAIVERRYKGQSDAASVEITYNRPLGTLCTVSKCESFSPGEYGLFFLSRQGDSYQLLDPYFGVFPASRLKSGGYRPGIAGLEADLITGLRDTDTKRLLTNIELIGALGHVESVSPLLDLLANNSNKMVRGAIYATLLRLHDYGKLRESLDLVEGPAEDSADLATREQILDLVSEIHDPTTLQVLVGFSRSHSDRLRECVIHALRGIGAAQAVPIFVDALDDPVQMIRYDAVLGLATVVRDWSLAPSVEAFAANERKYIEAWKAWWVNSGRKTYRRAGSSMG